MSPTSYQTAPPRDKVGLAEAARMMSSGTACVKVPYNSPHPRRIPFMLARIFLGFGIG